MKLGWAALGCVLAMSVLMPSTAAAQGAPATQPSTGALKQNYPNPFNPETRIPFRVGDYPACQDAKTHRVSLRIYNVLAQLVAVPMIEGGSGSISGGQPIDKVELPCGEYTAFWDGKFLNTGREVASGLYIYQLTVDGRVVSSRKMVVTK
jgi:hypothetical protein